jgi:hypothetical protein
MGHGQHSCDDGICQYLYVVSGTLTALCTGCRECQARLDFVFHLWSPKYVSHVNDRVYLKTEIFCTQVVIIVVSYPCDLRSAEIEYRQQRERGRPRVECVCGARASRNNEAERGKGFASPGSVYERDDQGNSNIGFHCGQLATMRTFCDCREVLKLKR